MVVTTTIGSWSNLFAITLQTDNQAETDSSTYPTAALRYAITLYADGCTMPNVFICSPGQQLSISATPMAHRQFVRWHDGNTDNPRSILVDRDSVLTAYFQTTTSGECGPNLRWHYADNTLYIKGSGTMNEFTAATTPWQILTDSIEAISIDSGVTSIGDYAFFGCTNVNMMTVYAPDTPDATIHTFDSVSRMTPLYVLTESVPAYKNHPIWGAFDVRRIGDIPTCTSDVKPQTWGTEKVIRDRQVLIVRDGVVYDTTGRKVEE